MFSIKNFISKCEILDWKHFYGQCYFMGFHQNFERSSSLKQLLFEKTLVLERVSSPDWQTWNCLPSLLHLNCLESLICRSHRSEITVWKIVVSKYKIYMKIYWRQENFTYFAKSFCSFPFTNLTLMNFNQNETSKMFIFQWCE